MKRNRPAAGGPDAGGEGTPLGVAGDYAHDAPPQLPGAASADGGRPAGRAGGIHTGRSTTQCTTNGGARPLEPRRDDARRVQGRTHGQTHAGHELTGCTQPTDHLNGDSSTERRTGTFLMNVDTIIDRACGFFGFVAKFTTIARRCAARYVTVRTRLESFFTSVLANSPCLSASNLPRFVAIPPLSHARLTGR